MSHYDCKECGAYGGIDFGICEKCTPPEYFIVKQRLTDLHSRERDEVQETVKAIIALVEPKIAYKYAAEKSRLEMQLRSYKPRHSELNRD